VIEPRTVVASRYQIISLLGVSDRKHTYLALDTLTDRQVTLAMIESEASRSTHAETIRKVLERVGVHSNIVTLYDYVISDDADFLVSAYLPGGTLREYLNAGERQGRYLTIGEILRFARQLARALYHIHSCGLIHRDVTPANIWLDERAVAYVEITDSATETDSLQDAAMLSTKGGAYTSPEQTAGSNVDERSDLYSLGAVLYEASTNEVPLRGKRGILAPRILRPDIPSGLSEIICRLLADKPGNRPASASAILDALSSILDEYVAEAEAMRKESTLEERFLSWMESLPFPLASILWRYHAEAEPRPKVETLLKFFEALGQFVATILLSAYILDRSFFDLGSVSSQGEGFNVTYRPDIRRPTFGTWVKMSQYLGDKTSNVLSKSAITSDRCYELFAAVASDEDNLVDALANPDFNSILQIALSCRNDWLGHGGVANLQEYERRLHELEMLLGRIQDLLGSSFETWTLLKPGSAAFTRGVFYLSATSIMGSRADFRKVERRVSEPFDTGRLYMLNSGRQRALELVPLIRILAGQKTGQDACYFFNRLQPEGVRWVSYHHQAEPELILPDSDILELLSSLRYDDSRSTGSGL
jgi:serine/threonine protein kinase